MAFQAARWCLVLPLYADHGTNYHCPVFPYSVCLLLCWPYIVYVHLTLIVLNNSQTGKRSGPGSLDTPKSCHKQLTWRDHTKKIIWKIYVEEKLINTTARLRHLLGSRNASPVDMQGLLAVSSIDSFSSESRSCFRKIHQAFQWCTIVK